MTFGEKVKLIRESKNLSTTKLAKMAGMAQSTLRDIELGNSKATYNSIEKICNALGMTLPQILKWDSSIEDEAYEEQLLQAVQKLTPQQKQALLNLVSLM